MVGKVAEVTQDCRPTGMVRLDAERVAFTHDLYREVAATIAPPAGAMDTELREQFVKMATTAFDSFAADSQYFAVVSQTPSR